MKASMSEGSLFLLCIKMASAPINKALWSRLLYHKKNPHTQNILRETPVLMDLHSGMPRLSSKLRPIPSQQWTPLHGQRCKSRDPFGCLYMPVKKLYLKSLSKINSVPTEKNPKSTLFFNHEVPLFLMQILRYPLEAVPVHHAVNLF